jgi:hypothetical protein
MIHTTQNREKNRKQNNKAAQVHHYDAVSYTTVLQRNLPYPDLDFQIIAIDRAKAAL